jgi:hypothetical protein
MGTAMAPRKHPAAIRDSDGALRALRDAVEHHFGRSDLDDLRRPMGQFCAHARREHMPPEQALIRLKQALDGVAEFRGNHSTEEPSNRDEIISLAIKTYYSDAN